MKVQCFFFWLGSLLNDNSEFGVASGLLSLRLLFIFFKCNLRGPSLFSERWMRVRHNRRNNHHFKLTLSLSYKNYQKVISSCSDVVTFIFLVFVTLIEVAFHTLPKLKFIGLEHVRSSHLPLKIPRFTCVQVSLCLQWRVNSHDRY